MPVYASEEGLDMAQFRRLELDMNEGSDFFLSRISVIVHTGTHLDAPGHFLKDEYEAGNSVEKIPMDVLIGHALVLDTPHDSNITADVLHGLGIPPDCERLLLRTSSTAMDLMHKPKFYSPFIGITADGAEYLVQRTNVKLVGIDYLSITNMEDNAPGHRTLLRKPVIPVEALDLSEVKSGRWYHLTCLPLKLEGSEGSPCRCIAWGPDADYEAWRLHTLAEEGQPDEEEQEQEEEEEEPPGDWQLDASEL